MGSPPQVRGKHNRATSAECCPRITPAGAGKTLVFDGETVVGGDHPRRCGENLLKNPVPLTFAGSPPQVRGKLSLSTKINGLFGITPAGAGKTRHPCCTERNVWDHPRRCGENFAAFPSAARTSGSPPQVRGKRNPTYEDFGEDRITPAGAGKTIACPVENIDL